MSAAKPIRLMAIDVGGKRTGIAMGDSLTRMSMPIEVLHCARGPALLQAIEKAIHQHGPDELVMGLPLNMDGSEGPAVKQAREFAQQVQQRFGLPVHLQDERLSSFEADQRMAQTGRTHGEKRELRDALAAAAILEDFLRSRNG